MSARDRERRLVHRQSVLQSPGPVIRRRQDDLREVRIGIESHGPTGLVHRFVMAARAGERQSEHRSRIRRQRLHFDRARGLRNALLITAVHPLKIDDPMPAPYLHIARIELQRPAELPVGARPVPIPHSHARHGIVGLGQLGAQLDGPPRGGPRVRERVARTENTVHAQQRIGVGQAGGGERVLGIELERGAERFERLPEGDPPPVDEPTALEIQLVGLEVLRVGPHQRHLVAAGQADLRHLPRLRSNFHACGR